MERPSPGSESAQESGGASDVPPPPDSARTPPSAGDLSELFRRVQASVQEERGPVALLRGLPSTQRLLLAGLMATSLVAVVLLLGPRADLATMPSARVTLTMSVYVLLLAGALFGALRPLHAVDMERSIYGAMLFAGLVAPFLLALVLPAQSGQGIELARPRDCGVVGLAVGGSLIALLRMLDRGAHGDPRVLAFSAAAAGLAANLALTLHCPGQAHLHLFAAHAPVGLFLWLAYRRLVGRVGA